MKVLKLMNKMAKTGLFTLYDGNERKTKVNVFIYNDEKRRLDINNI